MRNWVARFILGKWKVAIRTLLPFNYKYSNGCFWHKPEIARSKLSLFVHSNLLWA